jgi:hypothetical protein
VVIDGDHRMAGLAQGVDGRTVALDHPHLGAWRNIPAQAVRSVRRTRPYPLTAVQAVNEWYSCLCQQALDGLHFWIGSL